MENLRGMDENNAIVKTDVKRDGRRATFVGDLFTVISAVSRTSSQMQANFVTKKNI